MNTEVNLMTPTGAEDKPAEKKGKAVKTATKKAAAAPAKGAKATKKAAAPVKGAKKAAAPEGAKRGAIPGPRESTLNKKITKTGIDYKFHTGSQRETDYNLIKSGMTVGKYLDAGGRLNQLMLMSRCGLVELT